MVIICVVKNNITFNDDFLKTVIKNKLFLMTVLNKTVIKNHNFYWPLYITVSIDIIKILFNDSCIKQPSLYILILL